MPQGYPKGKPGQDVLICQSGKITMEVALLSGRSIYAYILEQRVKLLEKLKHGSPLYDFGDFRQKERFATIIFSELFFSGSTLIYQCKNGFKALESRFRHVCAQTDWLSEFLPKVADIQTSLESLNYLLQQSDFSPDHSAVEKGQCPQTG